MDAQFDRFKRGAVPITGRAGDLLVYIGQTWHTIGVNQATRPRPALLGQVLPFFVKPMEAHAWTLPGAVRHRLAPKAQKLLGLFPASFFQHSVRLAPLPRTPLGGLRFVADSLIHGYAGPHHPEMLRKGLELGVMERRLPACGAARARVVAAGEDHPLHIVLDEAKPAREVHQAHDLAPIVH